MSDDNDDDKVVPLKPSLFGQKYQLPEAPPEIGTTQEAIDWVNKTYFKSIIMGKFKIVREKPDGTIDIMDKKDFINNHEEYRVFITNAENGTTKSTPISELWLKSKAARKYEHGLTFDPSHVGHYGGIYNLWKGWRIKPIAGDITLWRTYVKEVMCSGHEENFNFLDALVSQMFREPHLKPGVTVVIRGDEGVGKSFFIERLCDLAAPYFFKTSNPAYVFGDHNGQLKHVIPLHLEEAVWPGGKKTESLLKDLISSPSLEINDKFVPVYSVTNHLHLFITGNPEWLAHASLRARRIFALHADDAHRDDTEYFVRLDHWFKNGGAEALMYHYLSHQSDINLRIVPVTDELIIQKQQSMTPVQEWWTSICETKEFPYGEFMSDGTVEVIKALLYLDYQNSFVGKRQALTPAKFAYQLLELLPLIIGGEKQRNEKGLVLSEAKKDNVKLKDSRDVRRDGYIIPNLKRCRELLEFKLGGKINWSTDVDKWTVLKGNTDFDFSLYKPNVA